MITLVALHISTSQTWLTISALLVGVLTPAVIAVVNHPIWQPQTKRVIAVGCAVLLGILTVIANGVFTDFEVTASSVVTVVLAVVGASQTAYALFWKPTGATDAIETKANPGPTGEPNPEVGTEDHPIPDPTHDAVEGDLV